MDKNKCPLSKELIQYFDNELPANEHTVIAQHVTTCDRCAGKIKRLKEIDKYFCMPIKKDNIINSSFVRQKDCLNDQLLFRYMEGTTTGAESEAVESHINVCEFCFTNLSALIRNTATPATEMEDAEIAALRTLTSENQVSKIISFYHQLYETEREKLDDEKRPITAVIKKFIISLKNIRDWFLSDTYDWKPAMAAAVIIIILFGAYQGFRYYNTTYQISQAARLMQAEHRIFIEDVRLSGGYKSSGISTLMAPNENETSYLEKVESHLEKAIAHGAQSIKAQQLLAQLLIIDKKQRQADSLFSHIEEEATDNPLILNDRGVLYYQKREWRRAAEFFQKAITLDNTLREPYFNLALTHIKLNNQSEAISLLDKYIQLEQDEGWNNAARHIKNRLHQNDE